MKEEVLEGKRFKHKYRNNSYYFNIFPQGAEIFASSVSDQDALTRAGVDALTRMTSLVWKHLGKDTAVEQLQKASGSPRDLPGILAVLIEENSND